MRIKSEQKTGPDWSRRKFTGKMAGRLYLGFKCPRILIQLILIQLILLLFPNKIIRLEKTLFAIFLAHNFRHIQYSQLEYFLYNDDI